MPRPPDTPFLSLVIHDLRNPLNAIGMALHMIEGEMPDACDELRQDIGMIAESARSLRKMLKVLSDYNVVTSKDLRSSTLPFDPRRLVSEVVAEIGESSDAAHARIHLEMDEDAPPEAELDQFRARMALSHAIANAIEAAGGSEVRVSVSGDEHRWTTRITSEQPPADASQGGPISTGQPQRLVGNALERRGLDLTIVSLVSEALDGRAYLEMQPGLRSSLVLDWARRPAAVPGNARSAGDPYARSERS